MLVFLTVIIANFEPLTCNFKASGSVNLANESKGQSLESIFKITDGDSILKEGNSSNLRSETFKSIVFLAPPNVVMTLRSIVPFWANKVGVASMPISHKKCVRIILLPLTMGLFIANILILMLVI